VRWILGSWVSSGRLNWTKQRWISQEVCATQLISYVGRSAGQGRAPNGAHDLFAHRAALRFGNLECSRVRRNKADSGRYIRDGFCIAAPEYLIFPRYFVGPKEGWILPSVRSKESRIMSKFGALALASCACEDLGKTHAFAIRKRRQYKRLHTLARNSSLRMLAKDHCQVPPVFGPLIDASRLGCAKQ
jgi:hypothetical protein